MLEDESVDITPKDYGVRTLAQEYGGGAFSLWGYRDFLQLQGSETLQAVDMLQRSLFNCFSCSITHR